MSKYQQRSAGLETIHGGRIIIVPENNNCAACIMDTPKTRTTLRADRLFLKNLIEAAQDVLVQMEEL